MAEFLLIRHGRTGSNIERRYASCPDEPLCPEADAEIAALSRSGVLPSVDAVYSTSALRCRRTAELLFPEMELGECRMRELDFGIFEGKNADELLGDRLYECWLESGCMGDIPGGDSVSQFKERCCDEFLRIAGSFRGRRAALVIHGGNIMSIMERFALPKRDFYDYHVPNCGWFLCRLEGGALLIQRGSRIL